MIGILICVVRFDYDLMKEFVYVLVNVRGVIFLMLVLVVKVFCDLVRIMIEVFLELLKLVRVLLSFLMRGV